MFRYKYLINYTYYKLLVVQAKLLQADALIITPDSTLIKKCDQNS